MMHARAYLLLEKEYMKYEKANIYGISITPVEENLMEWVAEIEGLKDSLWEGAELQLSLHYNESYNTSPPQVNFNTIPFHPNVHPQSGRPCLDFLDDPAKWNPNYTMTSILLSIQVLLSNPVLENAVNLEAAAMLKNNYPLYRQRVIQCVQASKHIEDIAERFRLYPSSIKALSTAHESWDRSQKRKVIAIPYEDYYMTWFTLATSKAVQDFQPPVFDDPDFIGNRYHWLADNVGKGEWDEDVHETIVHGVIERQKKRTLLEGQISNQYIPTPTPASGSQMMSASFKENRSQEDEQWEKEAADLVMWSAGLDQKMWN